MKRMLALVLVGLSILVYSTVAFADPQSAGGDIPYDKSEVEVKIGM